MGQDQDKRLALHAFFKTLTPNVYFQPPNQQQLNYPCIVYQRDGYVELHADNTNYRYTQRYQVTIIDRDPDSSLPEHVRALPMCAFNRWFASDDLNHDVYTLFI